MDDYQTIFIGTILVLILLWFILRELNCWYLKTNKILQRIEELHEDVKYLKTEQRFQTSVSNVKRKNKKDNINTEEEQEIKKEDSEQNPNLIKCIHCGTARDPKHACPNCHRW